MTHLSIQHKTSLLLLIAAFCACSSPSESDLATDQAAAAQSVTGDASAGCKTNATCGEGTFCRRPGPPGALGVCIPLESTLVLYQQGGPTPSPYCPRYTRLQLDLAANTGVLTDHVHPACERILPENRRAFDLSSPDFDGCGSVAYLGHGPDRDYSIIDRRGWHCSDAPAAVVEVLEVYRASGGTVDYSTRAP
jgi:hypothetical protein